ncbi:uncharacterized protein LOC133795676 [Humulus lupulus]|uniref:uncharacterized protein LOC133795676 n=1 Tax=Humulus lupulus TaxID=3486 RepID=UPI002B41583E|nr:uncharacterized protein LOC133795676 [Humulus lupulus]
MPNQGGTRLNFEEPLLRDGKLIAQVDMEEIEVETSFWNSTVVCIVLGSNPPFAVFEGFINIIWGKLGIERIARMNAGYTLVKFRDEATQDMVLEAGVVHFDRKPVILRPWPTDLNTMRLVKSVPIWVRLPGLGLQYWGVKCLSALVSTIGKPMLVEKVTKERSMGAVWRKKEEKTGTQHAGEVIDRNTTEPHFVSIPNGTDGELVSKDTQKVIAKEVCATKDGHDSSWFTPKRVGGVKHLAPASQNQMKNTYSALQDRIMEVTNLRLSTTNIFNGGLQHTWLESSEGRLLLVWQSKIVLVEVLQESDQFIHSRVKDLGSGKEFSLSFVYGRNTVEERYQLWQTLTGLYFPVKPWLLAGDFNSAFDFDNRLGGRAVTDMEMADAQRWRALGMVDELRTSGFHYTWSNKQAAEARIFSKLD